MGIYPDSMKILLDTNILFPRSRDPGLQKRLMAKLVAEGMTPVVNDHIVRELYRTIEEHNPDPEREQLLEVLEEVLALDVLEIKELGEYAPNLEAAARLVPIKDAPILATLMLPDMDLFITEDTTHFLHSKLLRGTPWRAKIRSLKEFLSRS